MIGMISLLYFLFCVGMIPVQDADVPDLTSGDKMISTSSSIEIQNHYVDILDLTVGDKIISSANILWGRGGGSSYSRSIVSVALKLDKGRYIVGEEFIYEISVKNISEKEILIPCDTDGDKINNGNMSHSPKDLPAGFMHTNAIIRFHEDTAKTDRSTLYFLMPGTVRLYGSDAFASSIKTLKPHESVMIRATGRWSGEELKAIPERLPSIPVIGECTPITGVL